jgi:carbonic anhydrase/acetyltransferase-like protein (isoleucine patch superfamily)
VDVLRTVAGAPDRVSAPIPRAVVLPVLWTFLAGRSVIHFARRVFIAEPLFRAYVTERGKGLHTGIFVHWIEGVGDIIVGDDVMFDGQSSIRFASRFVDRPRLVVGDGSAVAHGCQITVGKQVTIGKHCRIASEVMIADSSGHPSEASSRLAGAPPADEDVRPVTIGDNVWIGRRAIIMPGVTIGEGSVIASGAVVMNDIPPFTVAAGNPARRVASAGK